MSAIWENIEIEPRPKLIGTEAADCVVIGAGMAGLMVALELQKRGFGVVVLEARRICSGATANTTAKITAQHGTIYHKMIKKIGRDTAKLYYESNQRAIDKYERIIKEKQIDCDFSRLPAYIYARKKAYDITLEANAMDHLHIRSTYKQDTGLPFGVKAALKLENQGQFHPLKFAKAISKELRIYENSMAINIEDGRVTTPLGEVRASFIVNTTHYPVVNLPGLYFLRQHQERSYALAIKTDVNIGGIYYGVDDGHSLRNIPQGVIVGGENHRTGNNKNGGCLCKLKDFAQRYFPDAKVESIWSNQDVITHDGIAFIGRYSRFTPRMFVATGFNKWGMSLSAVASEIIPDLICGKENDYAKIYTPNRVNLKAAAPKLMVDIGYSVSGLCKGFVSKPEKRCTHLGCKLERNPVNGNLECPCHGSEFTPDGKVLFSPACEDLLK
ncbi:MAG: FAD-dependent oxidoreductase [Ruminococcus sp.]